MDINGAQSCEEKHKMNLEKKKARQTEIVHVCKHLSELAKKYEDDYGEAAQFEGDLIETIVKRYSSHFHSFQAAALYSILTEHDK